MESKIWLSPPHIGNEELKFVNQSFQDNWLTSSGGNVNGFEADLEKYYNFKRHVVALNSGTSAIHLALVKIGVQSGDEVLCQSFTFCGSVNPVLYLKAKSIFIDSEKETFNMCPLLLEEAIKDRLSKGVKPKAIILVHLYGMPAKMNEIISLSQRYDIPIVEDAAEALGATYNGEFCGALTDFGVLSFNGNKIITTTSGGALLVRSEKEKNSVIHLASQAKEDVPYYEHTKIGYNYRLSNVLAGIGRGQMTVLNSHLKSLLENHQFYTELFQGSLNLKLHTNPNETFKSNHWLNILLVNPSANFKNIDIINHLSEFNIEARYLWKPMHLQPVFNSETSYSNGNSEELFNYGLCLPSGSNLSLKDKLRIKKALLPFL